MAFTGAYERERLKRRLRRLVVRRPPQRDLEAGGAIDHANREGAVRVLRQQALEPVYIRADEDTQPVSKHSFTYFIRCRALPERKSGMKPAAAGAPGSNEVAT